MVLVDGAFCPAAEERCTKELEEHKNDPEKSERCLAFEDSDIGLSAAHAAGTMAFLVPDFLEPQPESRAKCVLVLPDLHAAVALLREHL